MSIRAQPGYDPIDNRTVIPLRDIADPMEGERANFQPIPGVGTMRVQSRKLTEARAFLEGKNMKTKPYTLYADHRRGTRFPIRDFDRIWHPDACDTLANGSPDYGTALTVDSVVSYEREQVAVIECSREAGR